MSATVSDRCTTWGHRYPHRPAPTPPGRRATPRGWSDFYWVCEECGMERRARVNRHGETRNTYRKPSGYSRNGYTQRELKALWVTQARRNP